MTKVSIALIAMFMFFASKTWAQDDEVATPHLNGFKIVVKDPGVSIAKYEKAAMGYYYFDQFRFLDKRREMSFDDGKAIIILYSANEMLKDSNKPISPLTIKEGKAYDEYILSITLDGESIKPQMMKYSK